MDNPKHLNDPHNRRWQDAFVQLGTGGADNYQSVIQQVTGQLLQLFDGISGPYSGMTPASLQAEINRLVIPAEPLAPLDEIVQQCIAVVAKNSIIVQHPHCIAHLHTPPMIPAFAAEAIISVLNQSMDSWDQASAATYVEQKMIVWLCELFGLDGEGIAKCSDGIFTSGGTQSNLMGLLLARDHAVQRLSGENVQQSGLPDYARNLRILCSETSHFTVQKSAALMGLGERAVVTIKTDEHGRIDCYALKAVLNDMLSHELLPFALVGTAGTTDLGAVDDLCALAAIAQQHQLWFHVDAAYGGALILSSHKDRLKGIECADSISVDFHKLFFQPISCGALLIRDQDHFHPLLHHADYLNRETDELPNLVDKSIATTRRFDALKLLMSLQALGTKRFGEMIDHLLCLTQQVALMIKENPMLELLAEPQLSTVVFRYWDNGLADLNEFNRQLRIDLLMAGKTVLGETRLDGKTCLKFTLLNPCLTVSEMKKLLCIITEFASGK